VLTYPASWEGQPEFTTFDRFVRGHGAAFVSRGKGKSYYLVPKPKAVVVPQPVAVGAKPVDSASVSSAKPVALGSPASSIALGQPAPQSTASAVPAQNTTASSPVAKPAENPPKLDSPLIVFKKRYCLSCGQEGIGCDPDKCISILKVLFLDDVRVNLVKLADRPVYRGGGSKAASKQNHIDGGISWFWTSEKHDYEKALDVENKESREFAALKIQLTDAKSAGRKGLEINGFWCMLDAYTKDGIVRKKAVAGNNGGAGK
jgi:hypothetical protein